MSAAFDDESIALNALLLLGFQATAKRDEKGPSSILLLRQEWSHLDTVKIDGPNTCEAKRIVGGSQSEFIRGDLLTVAQAVKEWPLAPIVLIVEEDMP